MDTGKKIRFIVSFLYICVICIIAYFAVKYLLSPLLPFITAFIIVSISRKVVLHIGEKLHSQKAASLIFTLILIFVISSIVYVLLYGLFSELANLSASLGSEDINTFVQKFSDKASQFFGNFLNSNFFNLIKKTAADAFKNMDKGFGEIISGFIPVVLSGVMRFLSFFPSAVIFACIMFISIFYISCDYDRICAFFDLQLSETAKATFYEAKSIFVQTSKELFKSYFVITFITFLQLFTGFLIIGIDYALILSAVICFIDLLPILGTGTVLIPWAVICFVFDNVRYSIGLLILYAVITLFRQLFEPKIVGANTGLSPLLSLVSIFTGLKIMGFAGILLFPIILMTIIKLNEKGFIKLYKNIPVKNDEIIRKTKNKFLKFKKSDK